MVDPDPMTCDPGSRVYDPYPGTVIPDPIYLVTTLPLERSSLISSLICEPVVFFPFIHHQFIIKVHMGCGALLHSAHFAPALYHFMN